MAFPYTDLYNRGITSGQHTFDGDMLDRQIFNSIKQKYNFIPTGVMLQNGELVDIRLKAGGTLVLTILLHRNGKPQGMHPSNYTAVAEIADLQDCPEDLQTALRTVEHLPAGAR